MRKIITAKFKSKCAASGLTIEKGEEIIYDPKLKNAYKIGHEPKTNADESLSDYIQAQEDAYFDNFCINNGI